MTKPPRSSPPLLISTSVGLLRNLGVYQWHVKNISPVLRVVMRAIQLSRRITGSMLTSTRSTKNKAMPPRRRPLPQYATRRIESRHRPRSSRLYFIEQRRRQALALLTDHLQAVGRRTRYHNISSAPTWKKANRARRTQTARGSARLPASHTSPEDRDQ
jgi:hypothetical protein